MKPNTIAFVESPTEHRNPRTEDIDVVSTLRLVELINDEDQLVAGAVRRVLPDVARAVDMAVDALSRGGTVHYFGAGSSGRIAVMDAAELPPTFGLEPGRIVAHHAGGAAAMERAIENIEDDADSGARDAAELGPNDVAIGLAASGRTPYVVGALRAAGESGARTVLISSNPKAAFGRRVDIHIGVTTGAEAIAGSTRMKAGTAAKLVLNTFSTAVMVRMGRTYSNLMVAMRATNAKLRGRVVGILMEATGLDAETCAEVLARAGGDTRIALVALLCSVDAEEAAQVLEATGGSVRQAVTTLETRAVG